MDECLIDMHKILTESNKHYNLYNKSVHSDYCSRSHKSQTCEIVIFFLSLSTCKVHV